MVACLVVRQFVILLLAVLALVGKAQTTSKGLDNEFGMDLHNMTESELEKICTDLGFALQKDIVDDATGEVIVFSHGDYVEAARQCLSIEKELEDVLAEHPEILEELEAERTRMMQEKERLEHDLENTKQKQNATARDQPLSAAFISDQKAVEGKKASAIVETELSTSSEEKRSNLRGNDIPEERNVSTPSQEHHELTEQRKSPQTLLEVLDELFLGPLPPPVKEIVHQVLAKIKQDLTVVLSLVNRHVMPLIGQLVKVIRSLMNGENSKENSAAPIPVQEQNLSEEQADDATTVA